MEITKECGVLELKSVDFLVEANHKLALTSSPLIEDPICYRGLVGKLIYLTGTWPELYSTYIVTIYARAQRSSYGSYQMSYDT